MSRMSRKQIIYASLIVPIVVVAGWFYARRAQPVVIASYVPESALGYLEINDWPSLVDNFTSTAGWNQIAPAYGVADKLDYLVKIGKWDILAQVAGNADAAILSRSQLAIVVTGIEVRGEEVKPRLALIAETHSKPDVLREAADKRLPELANNIFGQFRRETDEYGGTRIAIYKAAGSEKQLLSAQIESELILANHPDPLRSCIDTRLGRAPSMAGNFHLRNSRPVVERGDCGDAKGGCLFGFITGDGVTRLLRFWAFLISGDALSKAALAGAMGEVFTEFSARATDGIAFGAGFEEGLVVDRYALLLKPDMVDALKKTVKPKGGDPLSTGVIPANADDLTMITVENPMKTLDGIESAISARVGAAQSFLLHQFIIGAREAFLGLKPGDRADEAIGDEIASFGWASDGDDRVWLIAPRDRAFVTTLVERVFTARGAVLWREKHNGVEIASSSDSTRGAAAFVGDFLAIGRRSRLIRLIDSQRSGMTIRSAPQFAAASKPPGAASIRSFGSVSDESGNMMSAIARWTGGSVPAQSNSEALYKLPFAASATSINDRGIYIESRSPFGNFPFFISIAGGTNNGE